VLTSVSANQPREISGLVNFHKILERLPWPQIAAPLAAAEDALARLDERLRLSPIRQGWVERAHFLDACASLWLDGELVHLEDLVLHDADKDVKSPTRELTRAHAVLRARRRIAQADPGSALTPTTPTKTSAAQSTNSPGPTSSCEPRRRNTAAEPGSALSLSDLEGERAGRGEAHSGDTDGEDDDGLGPPSDEDGHDPPETLIIVDAGMVPRHHPLLAAACCAGGKTTVSLLEMSAHASCHQRRPPRHQDASHDSPRGDHRSAAGLPQES
jgi:hypothetical protein